MAAFPISILAIFVALSSFQLSAAESEAPAAAAPSGRIGFGSYGGWKPIKDLADPTVVRIADFAVKTYNREGNGYNLKLLNIVKAETQLVNGRNYRLVIYARNVDRLPPIHANFEAVVHSNFRGDALRLLSFNILNED